MDLQVHEQAVLAIDHEIQALMRAVRQLQFRKIEHEQEIKRLKGLTTLARKLPSELLAGIFEECVLNGWTRTPLTASHVCPEWRQAANTPTVWSHVYVNCDTRDPCGRTRFWLDKAQASSLYVTVDIANDASRIPAIMAILLSRAAQWQSFSIKSVLLSHANSLLSLCNQPFPRLRAVAIFIAEEFDENTDPIDGAGNAHALALVDLPRTAPHFRSLRICQTIVPSHGSVPSFITNLSITLLPCHAQARSESSVDRIFRVLEGLQALEELSVVLTSRVFVPAVDETRLIELNGLRALVLVGSRDLFRVLPHLSSPLLSRLHLRSSLEPLGYPDEEIGSNIRKFIFRATPPLELLELHDIDLSPSNFTACFTHLQHLNELRLHESDIPDSVFQQFLPPQPLCPLLDRLHLRWCGQVSGDALVNLVQARLASQGSVQSEKPPFKMITVINCCFVKEEDVLNLAQMTTCRIVTQIGDYCRMFLCDIEFCIESDRLFVQNHLDAVKIKGIGRGYDNMQFCTGHHLSLAESLYCSILNTLSLIRTR